MTPDSRGRRSRRPVAPWTHPIVLAMVGTAVLSAMWILLFPTAGTDLSAQIARADFAARYPHSAYDFSWYAGIYPAGYSVLAPFVFAFGGTRMVTAGAAVACAGMLAWMLNRYQIHRPRLAALWIAAGLWTGLISGRATFTLGIAAAVGSVALVEARWPGQTLRLIGAALLAALASLFSPVAGVFVGVAAAALLFTRRWVPAVVLGAAAGIPLIAIALLFGTGGVQPMAFFNGVPAILASLLVVILVPREWVAVRIGASVYSVGVVLAWLVPTGLGSNVERLAMLLAAPLFVAFPVSGKRRPFFVIAVIGMIVWQAFSPLRDLTHSDAPLTNATSAAPLVRELVRLRADKARLEAVPEYGHWESLQLANTVPLARGWERQIDTVRNPLFYSGDLTPAKYYGWLNHNAVHYIAISTATPDYAATDEARIVRAGQPWLKKKWGNANWQLYEVSGTAPLASKPAEVVRTTPAQITLKMPRAGSTVVRVHWTRFLHVAGGVVGRAGDWTRITVPGPGQYVLNAKYKF